MKDIRGWIAGQLIRHVSVEKFGEERAPKTKGESREFEDRLAALIERCQVLNFKPKDWSKDPHPRQGWFIRARPAQVRLFCAANQQGKTWALASEILSWCLGIEPWSGREVIFPGGRKWHPGMRFGIAGEDFVNALQEDIVAKMNRLLPLKEVGCELEKVQGRVLSKVTFPQPFETSIKFMSYEMEPSKWEGYTWDGFAFNEPPPRHAWIATKRGMMRNSAPAIFAMTPIKEPWIFEELYTSPDAIHLNHEEDLEQVKKSSIAVVTCTLDDSPYLSEDQKAFLIRDMDEDDLEARKYGRFRHLVGRVYKNFTREKHVLTSERFHELHPNWTSYPAFCVVDPHDRKAFAMCWGVLTPQGEKVIIEEWPDFDFTKVKQWKSSIDEYVNTIEEVEHKLFPSFTRSISTRQRGAPQVQWRVMDPNFGKSGKLGLNGQTVADAFGDRGLYFDVNVDDDLPSGHLAVRQALEDQTLFVLSHLKNTILAFENYIWDDYRGKNDHAPKEKPKDKYKDFMDLIRYIVKYDPHYYNPEDLKRMMIPRGIRSGPRVA